ncbi:lys-63-specific deubiquitinase BRCC36-like isoform X1 [Apis laboriosa]|uniref:Lys-63-specific deubiquitinase BRCC36 n=2 Tax=Apis TaxID=7459 RepID=A0A7M7GMU6_APIME|nr:lys-63-specific deubiquitinase BRCC36 [Apis mellifera]XP_006608395.1 lys-63-specific deubiquitinase BRCC36-like [Apis dorsata]XP_043788307.1 lys-63-specific deubiquitinase BRCC36-like isoform X1 [Apis laboriosa]XP_043788308.1 lys-63-specific deubiquitinase BRCC36-like isoform X1 [Apis laboriosa]XP_043788309.1 lys-63-specific deubiquitinase BRCC36-like isoform X1 [Apis laboriosa]XP_624978.4 lys-63-specific deubiquitinase BRCC36 [Apis mellifera]KAG6802016.1 lys-63-specific deubiquitinase BRC|eukprot:XP_006559788.2 lys-63-specific deubiquitinase BRCC36 [Apis mellifera]
MATFTLAKVELQTDVYMVCLQHALSTEKFEVMGLLIGDTEDNVARIVAVIILRHLDKKKDRVEISTEQLLKAVGEADRLSEELKRPVRILGWYHSHPHITVWPSHLDIRTQTNYQTMDHGFVGLIFSVFSESKESKEQEISLICFQSHNEKLTEIPLEIVHTPIISNTCLKTMTNLLKLLVQEEEEMAETYKDQQDILASIHNNAVRTRTLVHITDIITKPLVLMFKKRIALNKLRAAYLRRQLQELQKIYN